MEEEFMRLELDQAWDKHYEMISERSRKHSFEVGDAVSNKILNRYMDVKPYDNSRVKLSRSQDTDYINASLVTVPKAARRYILTQGPLPETIGHFWLMVWEQKSNVIVMLNRILEMEDFVKCEQYWPNSVDSKVVYEDVKLFVVLKSVKDTKHYSIREMLLCDSETGKSRTILQFHYTAWPDHGEPDSPTSFLRLLTAIRKCGGLDKMDEPTIVHCSAGIGRSGTFCLIDSILSMVENQGSTEGLDIVNTLIEMRDYRMGLIQSPVQLRFAYMSIIYGIKILENANKLHPHISSIKDSIPFDSLSSQQQKTNGSSQQNGGKKPRRGRKKQNNSSNSSSSLNIFKKHLLVEALDDVDSDSADSLFYDTMKPWPNIKKPRNSAPDDFIGQYSRQQIELNSSRPISTSSINQDALNPNMQPGSPTMADSCATKAQMLTNVINSMLTENTISTNNSTAKVDQAASSQSTDSVLLRRRERELRNQRLAEKTMDIKNRMKAEELRRELYSKRISFFKKSALIGGVAALILSSMAYIYLHGNSSS